MQLLSLKAKNDKREAGFMEYFDKDNLTLRHGDEESYMNLEKSQWPSLTGEANSDMEVILMNLGRPSDPLLKWKTE